MIWSALRRLIQRYGFFKRESEAVTREPFREWHRHPFFAEDCRNVANDPEYMARVAQGALNMAPAAIKARRLAQIARERCALKEQLAKAIRDKKARAPIYQALRALSIEELRVEAGK